MRFSFTRELLPAWRGFVSLSMLIAFLVTIALSDAPWLHEQIHKAKGAQHDCAVTILSAGAIEICGGNLIVAAPDKLPGFFVSSTAATEPRLSLLDFLLLEHAPPAHS